LLQDDVAYLPNALPMALAAQAYAKAELLWYFRHVGDKLPPSPTTPAASKLTGQLLRQQTKQPQLADDGHVVTLVAAAAAMYDLLVRHCTMFTTKTSNLCTTCSVMISLLASSTAACTQCLLQILPSAKECG
jgi:hypothetical protein